MKIAKSLNVLIICALFTLLLPTSFVSSGTSESKPLPSEKDRTSNVYSTLSRLEEKVSRFERLKTDFVQVKNLAIFKNKITVKGRIYIEKPQKVAWHVDEPVKYSALITSRFIRQWDEDTNRVQEMSLEDNPVFGAVIAQLTAWFSGRYLSLLDDYNVYVLTEAPLKLEFVPEETSDMKKVIKSITVTFREDERYLRKIHFQEAGGDSTTIKFINTVLDAPLDENDFRIGNRV